MHLTKPTFRPDVHSICLALFLARLADSQSHQLKTGWPVWPGQFGTPWPTGSRLPRIFMYTQSGDRGFAFPPWLPPESLSFWLHVNYRIGASPGTSGLYNSPATVGPAMPYNIASQGSPGLAHRGHPRPALSQRQELHTEAMAGKPQDSNSYEQRSDPCSESHFCPIEAAGTRSQDTQL